MQNPNDPLYIGERRELVSRIQRMACDNTREIRRYSNKEIRRGIYDQVRREQPTLSLVEVEKITAMRFMRSMQAHQGSVLAKPTHDMSAHAAARKAERDKMKGSRRK